MPVYEYVCTECGEQLEVRQSFTDAALTVCPACSGRLRKVLSPVGVVFKGSGFYRTDSRAAQASANGSSGDSGSADGQGTGDKQGKDGAGKESKDGAAAKADSSTGSGSGSGKETTGSPKTSATTKAASTGKADQS